MRRGASVKRACSLDGATEAMAIVLELDQERALRNLAAAAGPP